MTRPTARMMIMKPETDGRETLLTLLEAIKNLLHILTFLSLTAILIFGLHDMQAFIDFVIYPLVMVAMSVIIEVIYRKKRKEVYG